jgi:hypothetical protein
MFKELDTVILAHDMDEYGLKRGDIGAIVHRHEKNSEFEVEFVTSDGKTIALLTLKQEDIKPISGKEVLNARELAEV